MKLFLLLILLLTVHFISAKRRRYSKPTYDFQECFNLGHEHGQSLKNSCHNPPKLLSQKVSKNHLKICTSAFTLACHNAHQNITCDEGIKSAKLNGNCRHDHHSEGFKKCCNACKLGIEIKSSFLNCHEASNNLWKFDSFITQVIQECCELEQNAINLMEFKSEAEESNIEDTTAINYNDHHVIPLNFITEEATTSPWHQNNSKTYQLCSKFTSLCDENEICIDTVDSFICTCKIEFKFNSKTNECEDIDECLSNTHKCHPDEVCKNTIGSYNCEAPKCAKGFKELSNSIIDDEIECIDIDECISDPCKDGKICKNTEGSFECIEIDVLSQHCEEGFEMVDGVCIDINECREKICGRDEICTNLKGGFRCERIKCEKYYKNFMKTQCRRVFCQSYDNKCKKLPSYISHFFKVVKPSDVNKIVFSIEPLNNQIFTDFLLMDFDDSYFSFKKNQKGAEIMMKKLPINDMTLKFEIEMWDRFGKYKNKQINVYHVYVEKE